MLSLLINAVGRDVLSLIALVAVMVSQDPLMALLGFLVAPPAMLVLRTLVRRIKSLAHTQFTGTADIMETMQESLQGIRTVKAFTLEDTMRERIDASITAVENNANKMARVSNRSSPLMETLGGLAVAGGLMYGGYSVVALGATPGQFFSFLTAFLLAYEPAKRLARLNLELNSSLIGARKLIEIVDSPASEPDDNDKPPLKLTDARVELREVSFAYRPNEPVLNHMSFVAEPGKVTALVGPSGGGKSTVLALLLRFYEAGGGEILIDGQPISSVSRQSLRAQTAYVGQDVYLFRDTIGANIAFGKTRRSQDEIVAAAKAACAHDFIMGFPLGYDTPVGEHGTQLSGGQRQRVAVARALLRDAPIILLDEATAALDSESEKQVQEAIEHLCQNRTTIVIAHRLHTIMHADTILVVEGGEIVESGRHDDLLRRSGRYASFFRLQQRDAGPAPLAPSERNGVKNRPNNNSKPQRERFMNATSFVIPALPQPSLPVVGETKVYPVRRIWCVGRNYLEHIREMGNDERAPPFFFAKHADMLVPDGATVPYPPLTKDLHHEVELVVAMKSGGLNIPADKALEHVYGYAVGIDLTRRDLQIASRKKERPWEVGKSFDYSAPCSAIQPASKIGHPSKGKIWLTVNGKETQKGDLTELIWSVPEIIWQLSQQVKLAAGDIIMTGTPAGVSQLHPGDKIECGVDGVGTLKVSIGKPEK